MNLDVVLVEDLPHPREVVWRALTDPVGLAVWFMPNDFQPRVGAAFTMGCPPQPPFAGTVYASVLEMDPPHRMVWSWSTRPGERSTRVVFELSAIAAGTRLRVTHKGETDDFEAGLFRQGWPQKIGALRGFLRAA